MINRSRKLFTDLSCFFLNAFEPYKLLGANWSCENQALILADEVKSTPKLAQLRMEPDLQ